MKTPRRCAALLFLLLAACGKERVTVYQIPKETPRPVPIAASQQGGRKITWTAPKEWEEQPATQMRQGSFAATGPNGGKVDISITGFPGDAGGDLANVNRWRGQISLPPVDDAALQGASKMIEIDGISGLQIAMDEKPDGSGRKIVAAILHREGETWFFKMMGDAVAVSSQGELFSEFLRSVHFPAAAATAQAPEQPAADAKPKWTLPSGWQEQPAGGMRVGSFLIAEGNDKADVSVVTLGGQAGGMLANINRWRGQLSLPPVSEIELSSLTAKIPVNDDTAQIVDMAGDAQQAGGAKIPSRILGAIIERGGTTWFIKMTGPDALVEKHKPDFLDFVKSIQFPGNE